MLPELIYLKEHENDAILFYLEVHEHSTFQRNRRCQSIVSMNVVSHHNHHFVEVHISYHK